jgi:hypothetical protein
MARVPIPRRVRAQRVKVAKVNRVQQEPPARVLEQLLPTFQALSDDDLKTTELWVTLEPA